MNLKNKSVLIVGGARMGTAIASCLAEKGCDIALTYRHSQMAALQIKKIVQSMGRRALVFKADVTKENDIKVLFRKLKANGALPNIIVNLSSTYIATTWMQLNTQIWINEMNNNLQGAFLLVKHAAQAMQKTGGRIIHLSDWLAASGRPRYKNFIPYYTAKHALIGLAQAQALELAPQILVNVIAPGPILPPSKMDNSEAKTILKETPLKKWGGVNEIAKAVLFMCETDFVTGECLRVDGGRHLY